MLFFNIISFHSARAGITSSLPTSRSGSGSGK
jgi:hypothetical protein